jgi:hypothetical protein
MIIECGHCGAPLDVRETHRVTKCNYCGIANQVKSTRTIAFETPQGWRPPTTWTPPQHAAANSGTVLAYRAVKTGVAAVLTVTLIIFLVIGGGVAAIIFFAVNEASEQTRAVQDAIQGAQQQGNDQAGDAITRALAQASAIQEQLGQIPGASGQTPALDLLTDSGMEKVLGLYKETVGGGPLNVLEMTIHGEHSSVELQSRKDPDHVDEYRYLLGRVGGPKPVRLTGGAKSNLKKHLFDPEKTALVRMNELKSAAIGKLGFEQATVSHVMAERGRGKIEIRVYVSSPRDSGVVWFDGDGKVTKVHK